jgi:DNA-binding XRE family transcriptional regulator
MSGRNNFKKLVAKMTPSQRRRMNKKLETMREEMRLQELRLARHLTQSALAETLGVGQAAVAKLEKRTDMYVSNLGHFVEALGGKLRIVASFPDGDVTITNFSGVGAHEPVRPPRH